MANLELAIRLVTQATKQDSAKNYGEAARCYREAIVGFKTVAQSKNISPKVKEAILSKCALYEERLRKLDRYLLSKADLSKLFRECVQFHEKADSATADRSSSSLLLISYDSDEEDNTETLLKRGQELVEKGKRQDEKRLFVDAIKNYESGVKLILEAAHRSTDDGQKSEAIRFKCLLIHERIETIRNHLDNGAIVCDRRDTFDVNFGGSTQSLGCAGGFDSCSASPEPFIEESAEDRALLMEEIRSNLSMTPSRRDSVAGSRHSLYPTICEIKMSPVMLSEEDLVECKRRENTFATIPLADLNNELKLSSQSLDNVFPEGIRTRYSSSESHNAASSSLRSSLNDVQLNFEDSYERDCNVTELTYENSGLDIDVYKAYLDHKTSAHNDSGSDSGFGDPPGSDKGSSSATRTPTNSPLFSSTSGGKTSPISEGCGSLTDLSPLLLKEVTSSSSPSPVNVLVSAPATRSSSLRRSGAKRVKIVDENELRVVSSEDVVDGKILPKSHPVLKADSYVPASVTKERPEYVPPRAFAANHVEDDPVNKGCFYFMACLDSLWVL